MCVWYLFKSSTIHLVGHQMEIKMNRNVRVDTMVVEKVCQMRISLISVYCVHCRRYQSMTTI